MSENQNSYETAIVMLKKQIESLTAYEINTEESQFLDSVVNCIATKMNATLVASNIKQAHDCNGYPKFNPYHHGQYAVFLIMLGNEVYHHFSKTSYLPDVIDYVNTAVNNLYITCKMDIPKHFYMDHPMGTVIGRASIGEYFHVLQGCTIGASRNTSVLTFPVLGDHVIMCAHSTILGNCKIGDNVIIATGAYIKDQDVPSNSLVFGQSPNLIVKQLDQDKIKKYINEFWKS